MDNKKAPNQQADQSISQKRAREQWKKILELLKQQNKLFETTLFFAGTFDPIHNGHLDIIEKGSRLGQKIIVGIAESTGKNTTLPIEERARLVKKCVENLRNVSVISYKGKTADIAKKFNAVLLRGIRPGNANDEKDEGASSTVNKYLYRIDTILFYSHPKYSDISSTKIRSALDKKENISELVPKPVANYFIENNIKIKQSLTSNSNKSLFYATNYAIHFYHRHKPIIAACAGMIIGFTSNALYNRFGK